MRQSPCERVFRATKRAPHRFFLVFIIVMILPLLVGCGQDRPVAARLEYQPPFIPLQVSIDTNGEITFSASGVELPTPIGKFRASIEVKPAALFDGVESTLTVRFDGQDYVYDLHGKDFDIQFEQGYYEKVSITKHGSDILLELRRAVAPQAVADRPDQSTPTRSVTDQKTDNSGASRPSVTLEPSPTWTQLPTKTSRLPTARPPATPRPVDTATPIPTNTPRPTATPPPLVCNTKVDDGFRNVWEKAGGTSAGCPQGQAFTRRVAFQPFQNGFMYWQASAGGDAGGLIYVLLNSGSWQEYPDTWVDGMAERAGYSPPAGLIEPRRGFGYRWSQLGGPQASIGWALQDEAGSDFGLLQAFQNNAVILQFPGQSPVFLPDGKKWVR